MAGWIGQVDNAAPGAAGMMDLQASLRQKLGGGTVHVRADTREAAIKSAAALLGVPTHQVPVTPYNTGVWNEVAGGSTG